ncbi:hypothetical protein, partial [Buttiauxella noackiae]|uniref:hypothetical protein n=1 Tax=Buttiauxella noackiae TaxID=82992 RepID=UPI002355D8DB
VNSCNVDAMLEFRFNHFYNNSLDYTRSCCATFAQLFSMQTIAHSCKRLPFDIMSWIVKI